MDTKRSDSLEKLTRRIEKLERVIYALANRAAGDEAVRNSLLDLIERPKQSPEGEALLSNSEAAAYVGMARSTWRAYRAKHGIRPAMRIGKHPKFRRRDLEAMLARIQRE